MLDQDKLKELLHYDPETGVFTWRVSRSNVKAGTEAGFVHSNGYRYIKFQRKDLLGHRLAFLYMTGAWPEHHIDHINGHPSDNRWCNLRPVDRSANMQNQRKAQSHNRSGFLGVYRNGSRWRAKIDLDGKRKHLGYYDTPEEAHEAYLKAKRELHDGCTI
jgi:hypothetical protein